MSAYGMAGIGKTSLLKLIYNKMIKVNGIKFDFLILLRISEHENEQSGLSIEARLDALESEMGRLRRRIDRQDQQINSNSQASDQSWNLLNEDIRKIRDEVSASAENVEDLKDEIQTSFKDAANTHGNLGKRICDLEKQVSNLIAKMNK